MLKIPFASTDGKVVFAPTGKIINRRGGGPYTSIAPMHFVERRGWMMGEAFLVPLQSGRAVAEATYNASEDAKR
jgi:hypothetical protein